MSPALAPPAHPPAHPSVRSAQLGELERVAATYGFPPLPNEIPQPQDPESAGHALRAHLGHLRLRGTVLDPENRKAPTLAALGTFNGVPLEIRVIDKHAPVAECILCGGAKGETYTICAGCYTTQVRHAERAVLQILPDLEESALTVKALDHAQFVRAIRGARRLEPRRRARLDRSAETARRRARAAVVAADRAALLDELRASADEPGLAPPEQLRRRRRLHAAADAPPWEARGWFRGAAEMSLDGAWLTILAGSAVADERDADGEYPVDWHAEDWLSAPDQAAFLGEAAFNLPLPNTAAGGPEHASARRRNELLNAWLTARARAAFESDAAKYAIWLASELAAHGGAPSRVRSRVVQWDEEECERWDRWIDGLLGGADAFAPEALDPFDAESCELWGEAVTTDDDGNRTPVRLPTIDRGLPSGRLRWPQFVQAETEAAFVPWGRWMEIDEGHGSTFRVWTGNADAPRRRLRRQGPGPLARGRPQATVRVPRSTGRRPKGSLRAWEREIRAEWRRRRFERIARAYVGPHFHRLEAAAAQSA